MNVTTFPASRPRATKVPSKISAPLSIADATVERLKDVFKLLADKSRLKILLALAHDGEMHVSALCGMLGQSQPAVSHHLTLLRMSSLVAFRRDGKHNFYRVHSALVRDLLEQLFTDSGNGHRQIQFEDFSLAYKRR